ncbi:hypothetical protein NX773_09345 [Massilia solisilvae]|uniref:Uncharacterized protein n=1 Tax=Massilia solisilvae TaxID=1811225 RepID=A0ABT2BIP3_9BURK|nr:hypothetical protein [Massilia solisilvae]MCS0608367.1 hypothetical protein [Massilia solisilvae]
MSDVHDPALDLRGIARGAIGIAVMIVLAATAAWFAWTRWTPQGARGDPNGPLDFSVAGARLESAPTADRKAYFDQKQRLLHSWQWVDRQAGIARIPVEEAMAALARQDAARRRAAQAGGQR